MLDVLATDASQPVQIEQPKEEVMAEESAKDRSQTVYMVLEEVEENLFRLVASQEALRPPQAVELYLDSIPENDVVQLAQEGNAPSFLVVPSTSFWRIDAEVEVPKPRIRLNASRPVSSEPAAEPVASGNPWE